MSNTRMLTVGRFQKVEILYLFVKQQGMSDISENSPREQKNAVPQKILISVFLPEYFAVSGRENDYIYNYCSID